MQIRTLSLAEHEYPASSDYSLFVEEKSVIVQVMASTGDMAYLQSLLDTLRQQLPAAYIIGASSDETIDETGICPYGGVTLTIMSFRASQPDLVCEASIDDVAAVAEKMARSLIRRNTRLLIAFCDAESVNGEQFLDGLSACNNQVPVIGGVASTPTFDKTYVISGTQIIPHGAVMLSLDSDSLDVYEDSSFGWQCVGQEQVITAAKDNRIDSISNRTPLSLFRHYLGESVVQALPGLGSAFPLMIKRQGFVFARGIIGVDGESFIVSGNVKPGDTVFIGYGNPSRIVENNKLADRIVEHIGRPDVVLACYCEGRKLFLSRDIVEYEVDSLKSIAPLSGYFSLGEFYTSDSRFLLNFSTTVVALRETDENHHELPVEVAPPPLPTTLELVSEGLFNFIDVRTKELLHMAFHDEITELPNRNFLKHRLKELEEKNSIKQGSFALMIIGLGDAGSMAGIATSDEILQLIAARLEDDCIGDGLLVRYGEEELALVIEESGSEQELRKLADCMLEKINEPVELSSRSYYMGANIGVSRYPVNSSRADTILQQATVAMYYAKANPKSSVEFFSKEIQQCIVDRKVIEDELRRAIANDEFVVYYQPKINLISREIIGAEALVRWQHAEKGLVSPASFIPIAEDTGLIVAIGEKVLEAACKQARQWINKYNMDFRIAVNLSARQLENESIAADVIRIVNRTGLLPSRLELEITESMMMHDIDKCLLFFKVFNQLGVTLSLDDFGTGYSSLSYLKQLPMGHLKIDRSFVSNVNEDAGDEQIISAIVSMGHSLGLKIIAEGVENLGQVEKLQALGCDEVQGFYFGRPMPAHEFEELLHKQHVLKSAVTLSEDHVLQ